jgi:hypothetical protein
MLGKVVSGQNAQELEKEADKLKKVTQYFLEYFYNYELSDTKSKGKIMVHHIKEDIHQIPWVDDRIIKDIKTCKGELYVADVILIEKNLKYLLCMENSEINLISAYEQKGKNLLKIEKKLLNKDDKQTPDR